MSERWMEILRLLPAAIVFPLIRAFRPAVVPGPAGRAVPRADSRPASEPSLGAVATEPPWRAAIASG